MGKRKVKDYKTGSDELRKESCSDQESKKGCHGTGDIWAGLGQKRWLPSQSRKQCCKVGNKGMFSGAETPASSWEYAVSSKPSVLIFPEGSKKETLMMD